MILKNDFQLNKCLIVVFGNTGWHMILKGKVQPVTYTYHLKRGQLEHFDIPCPTPEPDFDIEEVRYLPYLAIVQSLICNPLIRA